MNGYYQKGPVVSAEMRSCCHNGAGCINPVVMWTPGFFVHGYYCAEHIPVGFNGVIPEDLRIENEVLQ